MPLFLAHVLTLGAASTVIARRLVLNPVDRVVAAMILFWTNIVVTGLTLSALGRLDDVAWLWRGSLLLAAASVAVTARLRPAPPAPGPADGPPDRPHLALLLATGGTLLLALAANLAIASAYDPNNYDSLTYHLPRTVYYLGHNHLGHFETADFRHVYYPFDFNLLQLLCLAYGAPLPAITLFNVAAWVLAGLSVYRVARLCDLGANAALVSAWLAATSLEILAQATSTTLDLPCGAALVAAVLFALRWRRTQQALDAWLGGTAIALSLGTKLTTAFFVPAFGLLLVVLAAKALRPLGPREVGRRIGAWIGPALAALPLGAAFVYYNYTATGELMTHKMDFTLNKPFTVACGLHTAKAYLVQIVADPFARFTFDLELINQLNQWFARTVFADWQAQYAFSPLYTIPPDLNEDHVFFGFAGPLFLACAVLACLRDPRLRRPVTWTAFAGLGWFVFYFATNKWSVYNQRYFIPPMLLLAPAAGAVLEAGWAGDGLLRRAKRGLFLFIGLSAAWCAGYYLVANSNRPLPYPGRTLPNLQPAIPAPLLAAVRSHPLLNVDSFGTNERIFPVISQRPGARVTSGRTIDRDKYHLFSFWKATRGFIYSNLEYPASYVLFPLPGKATAGVEFLGTIEEVLADSFDYAGLAPGAARQPATPANSNILVIVEYDHDARNPARLRHGRFRIVGLNPGDHAFARVSADLADGTRLTVLETDRDDWLDGSVPQPFRRVVVEIVDRADGRIRAAGELPFVPRKSDFTAEPAGTGDSLFHTELVSAEVARAVTVNGLASAEGPYPQWDLPRIRWAKQPVVRITVPADPKLQTIRLTFSTRLQARNDSVLEVLVNGRSCDRVELLGFNQWVDRRLDLPASPGVNVIELVDRAGGDTPDWLAYLDLNPDVKKFVLSQRLDPEAAAREHYETHGRKEGRQLPMRAGTGAKPPPDSLYFVYRFLQVEGLAAR